MPWRAAVGGARHGAVPFQPAGDEVDGGRLLVLPFAFSLAEGEEGERKFGAFSGKSEKVVLAIRGAANA